MPAERNSSPALVYVCNRRYLYLGRNRLLIRDLHSGAAALLVCLEGEVRFRTPGHEQWLASTNVLIPAGSRIAIDNRDAVLAACYLDAGRPDFALLRRQMAATCQGIHYHHRQGDYLTQELIRLRDEAPDFAEAQRRVEQVLYRGACMPLPEVDPRVTQVVERLRSSAALNISVGALAAEVGLSESGLIKLFALQVGVPLRRHRLWYRLIDFVRLTLAGMPGHEAIKVAGFSDAAHLSRCYSGFFGVNHSYAFSPRTHVRYVVPDEAVCRPLSGDVASLAGEPGLHTGCVHFP
ncbi:AraC family transcriptional regulator [Pseudomonas sp. Gutcm_11s]|uniref:AraC family transcriptional regulator n=1 Tax=Pseudomonas sp. Gutcm_11s TaxID=3026088 RepID=UPI002362B0F3|nr:AraC family transcriptional regulator [Pseudomonas sp. Gutcm_11s]MDD0843499.1 AraC family transcriptional regulator [Pseudomonas sp. Gutcm_11s]